MLFPNASTPTGTVTWTVLRSQYGILNTTGTLSIQKDAAITGGYKVTASVVNGTAVAVSPKQGNFFVSTSGQLSGTLPLPILGGRDAIFNGIRFKDATSVSTDMSEYAGQYVWAEMDANVGTGLNAGTGYGSLNLNADGTGRVCKQTFVYNASCANGMDIVATFDDPAVRNLIRIKQAATQSLPIPNGNATALDMLAVVRKFGADGVSLTADFVATGGSGPGGTGILYASRTGVTLTPSDAIGAWNYSGRNVTAGLSGSVRMAIANVGGVIKSRPFDLATATCSPGESRLTSGPVSSVNQGEWWSPSSGYSGQYSYAFQIDADTFVNVNANAGQLEFGVGRRLSADPTLGGAWTCQPF